MEICERKKRELEQLKNYYTEKYESLKRYQRVILYSNEKTREEVKNLVCNFDNSDDVRKMERLTHALNGQEEELKIMEKQEQQLQELKKYIDAKEKKLNYLLNLIKINIKIKFFFLIK